MTDNEIKCEKCFHHTVCEKATCAECQGSYCDECELYNIYGGNPQVENCEKFADVDLITRQKEQIEALISGQETLQKYIAEKDAEIEALKGNLYTISSACKQRRDEAVKEFAEKIKSHTRKMQSSDFSGEFWDKAVLVDDIDNLVKEMVGDKE